MPPRTTTAVTGIAQPIPDVVDPLARLSARDPAVKARITGLLNVVEARAGQKLGRMAANLVAGMSMEGAAVLAGMSATYAQSYRKKYPDVAELLAECEQLGFQLYETELMRRALAGSEDRNSARLLEIVIKARRAEYRDRQQVSIDVMHRAESHHSAIVAGWDANTPADSNETEAI